MARRKLEVPEIDKSLRRFKRDDEKIKYLNLLLDKEKYLTNGSNRYVRLKLAQLYEDEHYPEWMSYGQVNDNLKVDAYKRLAENYEKAATLRRELSVIDKDSPSVSRVQEEKATIDDQQADEWKRLVGDLERRITASTPKEKKVVSVTAIVGLLGGVFLLSSGMTGNVIGINQASSNWFGGVLFVIGLIGAFAYFKRR